MSDIIAEKLKALRDEDYRQFSGSLLPTVDRNMIIGVRTPLLRKLARELKDSREGEVFLCELPHKYYEEMNLHAMLVSEITDYEVLIRELNRMLPYVDNWGTCDTIRPVMFRRHPDGLVEHIYDWMMSEHDYTVRFGLEMLMLHYLDSEFRPEYLRSVSEIHSDEYYVKMMAAWYFAEALAKQYETAVLYMEEEKLDRWIHNKAIQKAVESRKISEDKKVYLKSLRRRKC